MFLKKDVSEDEDVETRVDSDKFYSDYTVYPNLHFVCNLIIFFVAVMICMQFHSKNDGC